MDQAGATGEASARKVSRAEWWMPTKRWALIGLAIGGAIAGLALELPVRVIGYQGPEKFLATLDKLERQ